MTSVVTSLEADETAAPNEAEITMVDQSHDRLVDLVEKAADKVVDAERQLKSARKKLAEAKNELRRHVRARAKMRGGEAFQDD